jgi:hypothetical protein
VKAKANKKPFSGVVIWYDPRRTASEGQRETRWPGGFRLVSAYLDSLVWPIVSLEAIGQLSPIDNDDPFESPLESFDRK